jgi:hypothetical protein
VSPRKRVFPRKLPTEAFSVLGPVPVDHSDALLRDESALGMTKFAPRSITLDSNSGLETQWQTLAHEIVHVALWDGGVHQTLSHEQRESVCDALGTYIAAAIREGYVKLTVPKDP